MHVACVRYGQQAAEVPSAQPPTTDTSTYGECLMSGCASLPNSNGMVGVPHQSTANFFAIDL